MRFQWPFIHLLFLYKSLAHIVIMLLSRKQLTVASKIEGEKIDEWDQLINHQNVMDPLRLVGE